MMRPAASDRGRCFRRLTSHDADLLCNLYLGMGFEDRRVRFSGGVSDESIARFCRTIDWNRAIIIGRARVYCLEAVVEIHSLSTAWNAAEIVFASATPIARDRVFAELLQLAAFAAGARGCSTLTMQQDAITREVLPLLRDMGDVECREDQIVIDIGGYVQAPTKAFTDKMVFAS